MADTAPGGQALLPRVMRRCVGGAPGTAVAEPLLSTLVSPRRVEEVGRRRDPYLVAVCKKPAPSDLSGLLSVRHQVI